MLLFDSQLILLLITHLAVPLLLLLLSSSILFACHLLLLAIACSVRCPCTGGSLMLPLGAGNLFAPILRKPSSRLSFFSLFYLAPFTTGYAVLLIDDPLPMPVAGGGSKAICLLLVVSCSFAWYLLLSPLSVLRLGGYVGLSTEPVKLFLPPQS